MSAGDDDSQRELERRLEAAGRFERSVLEQAARDEAPGEERLVELALRELGQAPEGPRRAAPPWRALLVAAAALALAALFLWPKGDPDPTPGIPRGTVLGEGIELEGPLGAGASFARFSWRCERSEAVAFRVLVYDAADLAREPIRSPRLETTTWEPDLVQRSQLPREILWEVRAETADGASAGASALERASRPD